MAREKFERVKPHINNPSATPRIIGVANAAVEFIYANSSLVKFFYVTKLF